MDYDLHTKYIKCLKKIESLTQHSNSLLHQLETESKKYFIKLLFDKNLIDVDLENNFICKEHPLLKVDIGVTQSHELGIMWMASGALLIYDFKKSRMWYGGEEITTTLEKFMQVVIDNFENVCCRKEIELV